MRRIATPFLCLALTLLCSAKADQPSKLIDESWEAVFIGNSKVAYSHTVVTKATPEWANQELVRVQVQMAMELKRFGTTIKMEMDYRSYETPAGKLVAVDNRTKTSLVEQRLHGRLSGDKMNLTLESMGQKTERAIPWSDDVLGPYAQDKVLREKPLGRGEQRKMRIFVPDLNRVMTATLYGGPEEEVDLLAGQKRKLQRIRMEIKGMPLLTTIMWVDDRGEALKSHSDLLGGMTSYRVSKELALAPPEVVSVDFGLSTLIKVNKSIPQPYQTAEVVYRVDLDGLDPRKVFAQDDRQQLRQQDGAWLLTVRAVPPPTGPKHAASSVPAEYTEPNSFIQSRDAKVVAAAKEAVGDATDPWQKAQRIERWVFQNVTEKNFSLGFATAAEVAQNREGDCSEHGVLLAAMARAAGIPSRVAVGLVYADSLDAFGYHLWTEVYVGGRWIPLDGTMGLGHASPVHIKLADASLEGVDAVATFLPVAQVIGRLKIEVVSWKHGQEQ